MFFSYRYLPAGVVLIGTIITLWSIKVPSCLSFQRWTTLTAWGLSFSIEGQYQTDFIDKVSITLVHPVPSSFLPAAIKRSPPLISPFIPADLFHSSSASFLLSVTPSNLKCNSFPLAWKYCVIHHVSLIRLRYPPPLHLFLLRSPTAPCCTT